MFSSPASVSYDDQVKHPSNKWKYFELFLFQVHGGQRINDFFLLCTTCLDSIAISLIFIMS